MTAPPGRRGLGTLEIVAAPVREQLLEMFRSAIVSGAFEPGERLIERELCEKTGASRTSIREALRILESEGLLTVIPNKGPVVTVITAEQAADIYEVRAMFEEFAIRCYCQRATREHHEALASAFEEVERSALAGDHVQAIAANDRFYDALLEGARSQALKTSLTRLRGLISYLRGVSMATEGRMPKVRAEMGEIYAALERTNCEAAVAANHRHVANASAAARSRLKHNG